MASRRHKHAHHEEEHENEERWLVSFADMMTLLFCLFMVLFAISSVNTSKLKVLAASLQEAFSGKVLSGGKAVMQTGSSTPPEKAQATPPLPAMTPVAAMAQEQGTATRDSQELQRRASEEERELEQLRKRIQALARKEGVAANVKTTVTSRGLVVELLTDKVFFDSGQALVKPHAQPLIVKIAHIIGGERRHPVVVEGHTDSQPISSAQFPSNWELSGARAGAVVRLFESSGVLAKRMSTQGFGSQEPAASNATAAGRSRNRRVVVVLTRIYPQQTATSQRTTP